MWILSLFLVFLVAFSNPVEAQEYCKKHNEMVKELRQKYNEVVSHRALNGRGTILEVAVAPDGGFTIILTYITRISCVIAEGVAWENLNVPVGEPT